MRTGTSEVEHQKAERTYLNALGPGQYNLPPLTGRFSLESKRKNIPYISLHSKVRQSWHPEYKTDFVGRNSPPSTKYSPVHDRTFEGSKAKLGKIGAEEKFKQLESIKKLKSTLPIQYGGIYDSMSITANTEHRPISEIESMIQAPLSTREYKKPTMGHGKRYDFTKMPQ